MSDRRRNIFVLLTVVGLLAASLAVVFTKPTRLGLDPRKRLFQKSGECGQAVDLGLGPSSVAEVDQAEKVRENKLLRMANRQGLALHKSRTRDPHAIDYKRYALRRHDGQMLGESSDGHYVLTLDLVEEMLTAETVEELRDVMSRSLEHQASRRALIGFDHDALRMLLQQRAHRGAQA